MATTDTYRGGMTLPELAAVIILYLRNLMRLIFRFGLIPGLYLFFVL